MYCGGPSHQAMDFFARPPLASLSCRTFTSLLLLLALGAGGADAGAAVISWSADSGNFSTAGNWSGVHTPPQSDDSLTFGSAVGGTLSNDLTTGAASWSVA